MTELEGKDLMEVMMEGKSKLASMPSGRLIKVLRSMTLILLK